MELQDDANFNPQLECLEDLDVSSSPESEGRNQEDQGHLKFALWEVEA